MAIHAVVPAAGAGSRMQADCPKQYLDLAGKCVLEWTLDVMLRIPDLASLTVVLSQRDKQGASLVQRLSRSQQVPVTVVEGGAERWQSVKNALQYLSGNGFGKDWVLVHDAARPCVLSSDIQSLIDACSNSEVCGGLLAVPVADTLKRVNQAGHVTGTLERRGVWAACTPQMFPVDVLQQALEQCELNGLSVTDEASAMESQGYHPIVVPCQRQNIKITYPEDLALAELILQAQKAAVLPLADNFQESL